MTVETAIETTGRISELEPAGDPWRRVAEQYLSELYQRSGSERTPGEYGRYVSTFLKGIGSPADATPGTVHGFAYAATLRGTVPRPATVMVRLAAIHGYYDLARRVGLIDRNPAADVRRPRNTDPRPKGLSPEQLRALLEATPKTPAGARDRAAILTAVLTGLRRSELLGLTAGDIEAKAGRVFYSTRTKGGHQRYRELPAPAWAAIRRALAQLGTPYETLAPAALLFPISGRGFAANLRRYAKRAGLEGVTPHVLRHSAAKLRRETGASIEDVGSFLGHRSLHTTSVYLRQLEGESDTGWQGVAAALGIGTDVGQA
jgi:site-specific recombinase XerD